MHMARLNLELAERENSKPYVYPRPGEPIPPGCVKHRRDAMIMILVQLLSKLFEYNTRVGTGHNNPRHSALVRATRVLCLLATPASPTRFNPGFREGSVHRRDHTPFEHRSKVDPRIRHAPTHGSFLQLLTRNRTPSLQVMEYGIYGEFSA